LDAAGKDLGLVYSESGIDDQENEADDNQRDVWINRSCDESAIILSKQLGWLPDLYQYKDFMCPISASLLEEAYRSHCE